MNILFFFFFFFIYAYPSSPNKKKRNRTYRCENQQKHQFRFRSSAIKDKQINRSSHTHAHIQVKVGCIGEHKRKRKSLRCILMIVGLRHMMCQLGSLTKVSRCVVSLFFFSIISRRASKEYRLVMK